MNLLTPSSPSPTSRKSPRSEALPEASAHEAGAQAAGSSSPALFPTFAASGGPGPSTTLALPMPVVASSVAVSSLHVPAPPFADERGFWMDCMRAMRDGLLHEGHAQDEVTRRMTECFFGMLNEVMSEDAQAGQPARQAALGEMADGEL